MPTTYAAPLPTDPILPLLADVMERWHERLAKAKVRVGVLWALNEDGPALKHGGYPVLARIKPASLELRVISRMDGGDGFDALLKIDEEQYRDLEDDSRVALLDHELAHLDTVDEEVDGRTLIKRDDIGRPKLRTVEGDWNGGDAFRSVIARHGEAAIEFISAKRAAAFAKAALEEFQEEHVGERDDPYERGRR